MQQAPLQRIPGLPFFRSGWRRLYSTESLQIFNRHVKRLQRDRAASNIQSSRDTDYLRDEVAQRICDRLLVISV